MEKLDIKTIDKALESKDTQVIWEVAQTASSVYVDLNKLLADEAYIKLGDVYDHIDANHPEDVNEDTVEEVLDRLMVRIDQIDREAHGEKMKPDGVAPAKEKPKGSVIADKWTGTRGRGAA